MIATLRNTHPWFLLFVIDATVPAVVAWKHYVGEVSASVALISACISLLALDAFIVVKTRSRNQKLGQETPRKLYFGAACFVVASALLTALAVYATPERSSYLELALSDTPLEDIQPKQKALVVELARRNAAASKAYERAALQTKPISPTLYSPDSFANESVIRSVSGQLKKAFDSDITYGTQIERNTREFHEKMLKVDPAYLKSFEAASQKQNMEADHAYQLEQQCVTSTVGLYDYAAVHSRDIVLTDGKLHFANEAVRVKFSSQLEESKSLYRQWQDVLQEVIRERQQSRQSQGISPNARDWP